MKHYTVLIAEDEPLILESLCDNVPWAHWGIGNVYTASNGIDACAQIQRYAPDIVLTDIRMPFRSGLEVLMETKAHYGYQAVILSGYNEFDYAKQAISLGVCEYLLKPVDFAELEKVIYTLVERLRAKDAPSAMDTLPAQYSAQLRQVLDLDALDPSTISDPNVVSVLEYIKDHYHEKVSLQQMGDHYAISPSYLNSKFKEATSYPMHNFLMRYRVIQGAMLLANPDMLIYEVAQAVGFDDYKHFIAVFKKFLDTTPAKYQESLLSDIRKGTLH